MLKVPFSDEYQMAVHYCLKLIIFVAEGEFAADFVYDNRNLGVGIASDL